jgi:hypothetical protein
MDDETYPDTFEGGQLAALHDIREFCGRRAARSPYDLREHLGEYIEHRISGDPHIFEGAKHIDAVTSRVAGEIVREGKQLPGRVWEEQRFPGEPLPIVAPEDDPDPPTEPVPEEGLVPEPTPDLTDADA